MSKYYQYNSKSENNFSNFWQNGMENFWNSYQESTPIEGFPCFCCLIFKTVSKGEEGEEDGSEILKHVVYMYPNNIHENIKTSFVQVLFSFTTYSIINLNYIPSSFSWSKSEIAIHSFKFENGNYLLFALKLPNIFTVKGVSCALERTLCALGYNSPHDDIKTDFSSSIYIKETEKEKITNFLEKNQELIIYCAFPSESKLNNPFFYVSHNIFAFEENPPLAIATQLDHFCIQKSKYVIGTATLFDDKFIVSSIPHKLSFLFPFYKESAKKLSNHKDLKFDTFQLTVPISVINAIKEEQKETNNNENENDDQKPILYHLSVMTCNDLSFFVLVKDHEDKETVISTIKELLLNGISDFSLECRRYSNREQSKEKFSGIAAYWPHSGIFKYAQCKPETFSQMADIHSEMSKNDKLLEYVSFNGETQISGLNLLTFEVFAEVECKGNLRASVEDTYSKIKQFLPNLPDDLQDL